MDFRVLPAKLKTPSLQVPPQPLSRPSWFRIWLVCLAFYLPVYWACQFLLFALPGLIRVVAFGERLRYFQANFFNMIVISSPTGSPTFAEAGSRASILYGLLETVLLVAALAVLLGVAARRRPVANGLVLAMLGQGALLRPLVHLVFERRLSAGDVVASLFFFAVLTLGLRCMLAGLTKRGYLVRVGALLSAFSLPLALMWGIYALVLSAWFPRPWVVLLLIPGAIAALVASALPARRASSLEPVLPPVSWRPLALGVAATLLLATGITWGDRALNQAFARARRAENLDAMASYPTIPPNLPYPKIFFQKGATLTAEFPDVYASEGARRMLEALPRYGINAVALVPYGFSPGNQPLVRMPGPNSWESDEGLEELSRVAHARGMKVLLKPSLWLERGFPGDLEFSAPQERAKWFAAYQQFLEHYARLAPQIHADIFCVGVELAKLTPFDSEWRKLIARVRELYPGPLVYAANFGPEFEGIKFWDALDYIGLQEYYPLPDDLSTDAVVQRVEAVQKRYDRPVIFTEAGFSSNEAPNREPWSDADHRKLSPEDQARCYEAILRTFYNKPYFQGVYWWAIRTNAEGGLQDGSLTPWGKPAMDVLARWYSQPGR